MPVRLAAALVLLAATFGPALAVTPQERLADPALEQRARQVSAGLRCLVCQNQSIDDSEAPLARDLRVLVRDRIKAATAILDRCPGLGPSSSVAVSATVASTVMELGTDDLLEAMRRTLLAEGATEAEAAAKVEALRAKVAASP